MDCSLYGWHGQAVSLDGLTSGAVERRGTGPDVPKPGTPHRALHGRGCAGWSVHNNSAWIP